MLTINFEMGQNGITVPYPPISDEIRCNHGFVDLRGRPDLAAEIPEGLKSRALKELLVRLSETDSNLFTLGCDLGSHEEPESKKECRYVAGGYLQLMDASYQDRLPGDYYELGRTIARVLKDDHGSHNWILNFVLTPVHFNLDEFCSLTGSLWIWFYASSHSPKRALKSREMLIKKIHAAVIGKYPTVATGDPSETLTQRQ